MNTNPPIWIWAIIIIVLIPFIAYVYLRVLPKILTWMAEQNILFAFIEENSWMPIEESKKFSRGILHKSGFRLSNENETGVVTPGATSRPKSWLARRGLIFLAWNAPAITNPGTLKIEKVRMLSAEEIKDKPLKDWIKSSYIDIRSLRITFPRYVFVENIETWKDGNFVSVLVMAQVEVITPYLTWYGLGGKAYEAIDTAIRKKVREEFEKYSLRKLLLSDGQDKAEAAITSGVSAGTIPQLGVNIPTIRIEEWEYKTSDEFKKSLQAPELARIAQDTIVTEQKNEEVRARKEVLVQRARGAAAEEAVKTNKKRREAFMALAGDADGVADTLVLSDSMESAEFIEHRRAQARERTKIHTLVEGGASALLTISTQSEEPKKEKDGKGREKEDKK